MNRTDLLNFLITTHNYKSYLEIGVYKHYNFDHIILDNKTSVDPDANSNPTYCQTSDEFFGQNKQTFDLIFIDGLHLWNQVYKDIINSLNVLNHNGTIVVHDVNPIAEQDQLETQKLGTWNGTTWKAFVELRMKRSDLEMQTVDLDNGCGIIRRGFQQTIQPDELTWDNLQKHRKHWLNLTTVTEFMMYTIQLKQLTDICKRIKI